MDFTSNKRPDDMVRITTPELADAFIEEAVDAMLKGDDENLCEELGDVLLQVVLNAQIGAEDGTFTIDDVVQGISEKMIRRHPWVFGDMDVSSIDENVSLWEQIKQKEKEEKKNASE